MTITAGGDKIAPVADDGALKKRRGLKKAAGNHVSRRRGGGTAGDVRVEKKGAGSAEKTDEKNC